MNELDFLRFKEFEVNVAATVNSNGSGGWEVSLTQGGGTVILTIQQLDRVNKKIQDYILESLEAKQ
jgi:hypothetical protein